MLIRLVPRQPLLAALALVGTLPCAVACVDAKEDYEAFVARVQHPHVDAGHEDAGDSGSCVVAPGMIDGSYALSLSVSIARTTPIMTLTHVTTPAFEGGTGVAFDAQPLRASDRKTPVGYLLSLGPFAVSATGEFHAQLTDLQVTGAANPITGGDIAADVVLAGNLCGDPRFFCGDVTGNVTAPIQLDLTGSTFTLTRIDGTDAPPARPAINCNGDLSDPL